MSVVARRTDQPVLMTSTTTSTSRRTARRVKSTKPCDDVVSTFSNLRDLMPLIRYTASGVDTTLMQLAFFMQGVWSGWTNTVPMTPVNTSDGTTTKDEGDVARQKADVRYRYANEPPILQTIVPLTMRMLAAGMLAKSTHGITVGKPTATSILVRVQIPAFRWPVSPQKMVDLFGPADRGNTMHDLAALWNGAPDDDDEADTSTSYRFVRTSQVAVSWRHFGFENAKLLFKNMATARNATDLEYDEKVAEALAAVSGTAKLQPFEVEEALKNYHLLLKLSLDFMLRLVVTRLEPEQSGTSTGTAAWEKRVSELLAIRRDSWNNYTTAELEADFLATYAVMRRENLNFSEKNLDVLQSLFGAWKDRLTIVGLVDPAIEDVLSCWLSE